jgi:hypothetical protein
MAKSLKNTFVHDRLVLYGKKALHTFFWDDFFFFFFVIKKIPIFQELAAYLFTIVGVDPLGLHENCLHHSLDPGVYRVSGVHPDGHRGFHGNFHRGFHGNFHQGCHGNLDLGPSWVRHPLSGGQGVFQ